jgi:tetratricopeptide (TPR) repeat protein
VVRSFIILYTLIGAAVFSFAQGDFGEGAAAPEESPFDKLYDLKQAVEAGEYTPDELAAVLAEGNADERWAEVAEVAEIALGTPTATREAEARRQADASAAAERKGESRPVSARKFFDGIDKYKNSAKVNNEAGVAYVYLGRSAEALEALERAASLDARYDEPLVNIGVLHRRKGWYEEALAKYDEALAIAPSNAVTWYNKGVVLLRLERLEDGIKAFKSSAGLAPAYRPPVRRLALIWLDIGDYEEAQKYLKRLKYLLETGEGASDEDMTEVETYLELCDMKLAGPSTAIETTEPGRSEEE